MGDVSVLDQYRTGRDSDVLVEASFEDRDHDPRIARMQDDRDKAAARDQFDVALALHDRINAAREPDEPEA